VSAIPPNVDPAKDAKPLPPLKGEPILHFEKSANKVEMELSDLESLLDRDTKPVFPHSRPMLNSAVAEFMVDTAREDRHSTHLELAITFRSPPLKSDQEEGTRAKLTSFFANEVEVAELQQRVNRIEAFGSLRFALPVVAVAAVFAALLSEPSLLGLPDYVTSFAYLVTVVVVWLMVWDPIEKLLFDSYFIRLRVRALKKLVAARITFAYRPGAPVVADPAVFEDSPIDSIIDTLEG
jgi:hypothetical protein